MTLAASRLANAIGRAVFALLLMFAAVSPAFAELGCIEDRIAHSGAPEGPASQNDLVAEDSSGGEDRNGPIGKAMHCAFSHCGHGLISIAPQRGTSNDFSRAMGYAPQASQPLAAAPRDGPDYPPRA